jgi:translation initiation factor 1 (eIF-1/SUI1)
VELWIKNKRTGMVWEIVDEKMIKRLLNSDDYEEIQVQHEQKEQEQKIDLKSMKFNDLKKLASEKGINTFGMDKKQIIKALKKVGV